MEHALPVLRIGTLHVGFPVVQAALSGYSDLAMRLVSRRMGASYALCEVVLDRMVLQAGKRLRRHVRVDDADHPVAAQLMGSEPAEFAAAAAELAGLGFDVIDINFGCPVKKVLGRCRGGWYLSQPQAALEVVSRVRDAVPPHVPVTLKMRRGLDDSAASRDRFFQIFEGAWQRGVSAITVHGRTVVQRYLGPSDWTFLAEVKRAAGRRTVLGSGDLFTAQACLDMLRGTGVDGVTVARGAIGNPWIFAQARALAAGLPLPPPPSVFEQREVLREHFRLAEELYGPERCGRQMRKFGIKYARLHPHYHEVREAFVSVSRPADWHAVLERFYAEDLPGCYAPALPEGQEYETCQAV
ncbi:MAG: tRNA-dihydrouridine synthase family protein [Pirellulales bacterium]|nr:tRNA-dihydrouridine synthase family protein [Pirellulales bacterium]